MVHDLVEIGPESFIADGVVFGDDKAEPNMIRLGPTRIGRRSFIGNSALIPTGSTVGDDVLIGVLSRPPEGGAQEPGSTWFGLPPIRLPHRQIAVRSTRARASIPPRGWWACGWQWNMCASRCRCRDSSSCLRRF